MNKGSQKTSKYITLIIVVLLGVVHQVFTNPFSSITSSITSLFLGAYTSNHDPLPDAWLAIGHEAAINVREFFAQLGYKNPRFDNPQAIRFINCEPRKESLRWGFVTYDTSIGDYGVFIDKSFYQEFIKNHPQTGLATLKALIHHELIHLFLYNVTIDNKCSNLRIDHNNLNNTIASHEFEKLMDRFIKPYLINVHEPHRARAPIYWEQMADVMGTKASKCPLCTHALASWNYAKFTNVLDKEIVNPLDGMPDDQLKSAVSKHIAGHISASDDHPCHFDRAGYCSIIARELTKQGYTACKIHA